MRGYAPLVRLTGIVTASLFFMMFVVEYFRKEEISTVHPNWAEAILMHCDEDTQEALVKFTFSGLEFTAGCVSLIAPGSYLGILVDAKFFKGAHRALNETSVCKSIFRFSFTIILLFPCLALPLSEIKTKSVIL